MSNDTLLAFDLETTSADNTTTTPVQICLIASYPDSGPRILMNSLVRPGEPISPEASKVHGITNEMVANAPDYKLTAFTAYLLTEQIGPDYLVGFNSKYFDEPIIDRCLGMPVFGDVPHLDVLDIAYRYFPEMPGHKLGVLYEQFTGKSLEGAHDAAVDVLGTLELLEVMRTKLSMTYADIAEDMKEAKPYPILPIGKHKGKLIDDIPKGWAKWMNTNATGMRPDLKTTVEYILNR